MIGALRYFTARYFPARFWPKVGAGSGPSALDLCTTSQASLMPTRSASSLMPARRASSLMAPRTVEPYCDNGS